MSLRKRVDPRVIGSFVVGAVMLTVAGLMFFGPGGFLSETRSYVIYFDSSVKGLNVGSPVRFRGVKIGQIREINVRVQPEEFKFYIPVVIEIEPSRFKAEGTDQGLLDSIKTTVKGDDPMISLVDKGLRAQMQLDSLVTGQLYVNLDMLPATPLVLTGYPHEYPEIPAITSSLEELTKTFSDIPLQELADKLIHSAEGFEKLINSPSLHSALSKFDDTTTQLNQLLLNLNEQLFPIVTSLQETLTQSQTTITNVDMKINQTLQHAQTTIAHIDAKIDPLSEQFSAAVLAVNEASVKTEEAMQQIKGLTKNDSQILQQLGTTLEEVNRTARSLRYMATELDRDPQILLRGRVDGGTK
ncbi:paraquat-inducible protein B [Desulfuromusa kysingii]|uniref:Paraquat-inducible protein B n=1 Tax=Desulfuromusa kysingii TaxID=37625 RepID=A0A1H3YSW6_9BACT|nr:MlaD family protein [Desulfuromusa kysingii]SEA14649.1 paraquat-inducible protein B [Desulfuromusa kysingii]